ncbi:hypothetical protein [Oceanidesulfovibrio marinus]|uniref:Uncharacterized protein n=1 Tax=Oceanidesulfovibrio marinus TaxID=370038 RepID=A0A6P1ZIK7_9BACT|nr:hypothetical protein [Oceanidesulfovibrio marinus]QJT08312.1 hypothetical protein E8L03_04940 [Oceanidesulfovibrio marinus]TVM35202.1 hypothetical protein DQK91_07360 [Oceanidesulfovibrio marinus]
MTRSFQRLAALALITASILVCAHGTAVAQSFRVLVSTDHRQLRSMMLDVTGYSTSPRGSEETLRQEALDDACRRALEIARKDLQGKIDSRHLKMHLAFLGEPEVAPMQGPSAGNKAPSAGQIARTAVFIHSAEKMEIPRHTGGDAVPAYALSVTAEVVYVLQPTDADENHLQKPPPLPMAQPGQSPSRLKGEAGQKIREEAEESMAKQLLEAITSGGADESGIDGSDMALPGYGGRGQNGSGNAP